MATLRQIQSPGVQINEIDLSTRATAPNGTNVFITGFASQGPTSEIVNLTTISDFLNIFGAPTNAAERYFYYSVQQQFTGGTNATVSVVRLPYGTGLGDGYYGDKYSALVFPVLAVPAASSLSQAATTATSLANAASYYFTQPTLITLSVDQYNQLKQNGINWSTTGGGGVGAVNFNSLSAAGMIIINEARTTINEKFEGLYVNLADNTNFNPSTNYESAQLINTVTYSTSSVTVPNTQYSTIPTSLLSFKVKSLSSDGFNSLSREIENIPSYTLDVANSSYSDIAVLSLFKLKTTPFGTNPLQLSYSLQEGYASSFYSNRYIQDQNGGAPVNDFIQNVVNTSSNNISVLVNPNISNNTNWLDLSGNATKQIKVLTTANATSPLTNAGYAGADKLFPLGVYNQSLDTTTNKAVGDVLSKLTTVFNVAENADIYNIDIVVDAGISTIAAAANGDSYDDTALTSDILLAIQNLATANPSYAPSSTAEDNWNAVTQMFTQFAGNIRKDCIFISDPLRHIFVQGPNFKTLDDKLNKNFSNNIYWPLRNLYTNYNTSYAATYGNWVKVVDSFTTKQVWVPFSGFAAAAFTNNDAVSYPWGAPAGLNRGNITGIVDIAINPQQKQRDLLYKISVNPVVNFPNGGYTIYGQKTLSKVPSAFDRINVRRLFLFLEKAVLNTSKFFVFEPNTTFTRNRLVNTIDPVFSLAKNTQGLYDYLIVCNNTNNPPSVIDDNSLVVDIYIKPVRTAEFILVNFYATKTSQNFNELIQ